MHDIPRTFICKVPITHDRRIVHGTHVEAPFAVNSTIVRPHALCQILAFSWFSSVVVLSLGIGPHLFDDPVLTGFLPVF